MKIDELKALIRELIKTELDEANTTGTGTSITTGNSEAYATLKAFGDNKRKKRKTYMGYKEIK